MRASAPRPGALSQGTKSGRLVGSLPARPLSRKGQVRLGVFFLAPAVRREDDFAAVAGRERREDVAAVSDRESGGAWRFPRHRRAGRVRCSIGGYVGCAHRRRCAPARRGPPSGRIGEAVATLRGTVSSAARRTVTFRWEYGTRRLRRHTPARRVDSSRTVRVRERLTGLRPGTRYRFRLMATTCGGCRRGTVRSRLRIFTTRTARPPARIRLPAMRPTRRPHQP